MSVYFRFSNENNRPYVKDLQFRVCWGFLKNFKFTYDQACSISYPWSSSMWNGLPTDKKVAPKYLQVFRTPALHQIDHCQYLDMRTLYNKVLKHLPQWFGDFKLRKVRGGDYYLTVPMESSSLKNYNALRMIRNLLYLKKYFYTKGSPLDCLVSTEFIHRGIVITRINDGNCAPLEAFNTLQDLIAAYDKGVNKEWRSAKLNNINGVYLHKTYGRRYMERAFVGKELHALHKDRMKNMTKILERFFKHALPTTNTVMSMITNARKQYEKTNN